MNKSLRQRIFDVPKKYLFELIALLTTGLLVAYIFKATRNVIYTDDIRDVNAFFNKNFKLSQIWFDTGIHHAPGSILITYLNGIWFKYNIQLEMVISAISIFISFNIILRFLKKREISLFYKTGIFVVLFTLTQWEMLINNTGLSTYITFVFIYLNYVVIDDVFVKGEKSKFKKVLLFIIPPFTILLFAGGYSAAYVGIAILTYIYLFVKYLIKNKKIDRILLIIVLVNIASILIYIAGIGSDGSSSNGVTNGFFHSILNQPLYMLKFFIASFSSVFIGVETFTKLYSNNMVFVYFGLLVILIYLITIIAYFKKKLYDKTIFPLMLIGFSLMSHLLVLYARFDFNSIIYGMSSRYYIQYSPGVIGIIIIWSYVVKNSKAINVSYLAGIIVSFFILGNIITTIDEYQKMPYRGAYFENLVKLSENFEVKSDEDLKVFEANPDDTRSALEILKQRKWNVFE